MPFKKNSCILLFLLFAFVTFAQDSLDIKSKPIINTTFFDTIKKMEVPVLMEKDTLFYIKTSLHTETTIQRAKSISKKLTDVAKTYKKKNDSIYIQKGDGFSNIMYNNQLLFTTTKKDAISYSASIDQLATKRLEALQKGLYNKNHILTVKEWLFRIGYFILSVIGFILFFKIINWVYNLLEKRLSKFEKIFLKKNKNILKYFIPKSTKNIFVFLLMVVKSVVILAFLLTYLPFMFSFFPLTEGIVTVFYDYISTPVKFLFFGFIDFIPSLIFIIVIIYFTRYIIRVLKDVIEDIENEKFIIKGFHKDWANPTGNIIKIAIYAFAMVMIFPHIPGSSSSAFKGVSIFIGAILSFGSTSAIANIIAGIVITYMRPFQVGDRVKIDHIIGDVVEKNSLVTRIKTFKNVEITIPNANILNGNIVNYTSNTKEVGLILHTSITLGYDVPWDLAQKLLLRAAKKSILIQKDPKPFVLQTSLDDNYVSYELNAYTKKEKKMPLIYSDLHKNILEVFNEAGVEILSPQYVAARDGNLSTVPSLITPDSKSPIHKLVDHLTGKNQEVKVKKVKKSGKKND